MEIILTKKEKEEKARKDALDMGRYRERLAREEMDRLKRLGERSAFAKSVDKHFGMIVILIFLFLFAVLPALLAKPLTQQQALDSYSPDDSGYVNSWGFRE